MAYRLTPDPKDGTLGELAADEQREVTRRWQRQVSGMDGPRRRSEIETPDDPVAFKLFDAAEDAIGKSETRQGVAILKLLVKEFAQSQEAALARHVLDGYAERLESRRR